MNQKELQEYLSKKELFLDRLEQMIKFARENDELAKKLMFTLVQNKALFTYEIKS